ncbi:MAG: hypothetical protein KatS3mg109_0173 [Pirellulaceae bacterium]|nr:MAG: hypothetical protein KatS3mg109_0173 [Pirellulaceae bacterium]
MDGHRFFCKSCRQGGDLLDLICRIRGIKRNLAIAALERLCPELASTYQSIEGDLEKNAKIAQFADRAWQKFYGDPPRATNYSPAIELLKQLAIPVNRSLTWSSGSVTQTVGYATDYEFEKFMRLQEPSGRLSARMKRRYLPDKVSGCVLFPIRIVPDVIEGFQICYFHEGRWQTKLCMFPYRGRREAGIIGHPNLLISEDPVYVFDDFARATRIQFDWMMSREEISPLLSVGLSPQYPTTNLQALRNRKVVFWTPELKPEIIRQAVNLDANLSVAGYNPSGGTKSWVTRGNSDYVLSQINRTEKHWTDILAAIIQKLDTSKTTDLFQMARLSPSDIERVLKKVNPRKRQILRSAILPSWPYGRLSYMRGVVEQRESGWFFLAGDSEELITDAPFRITSIESREGQFFANLEVRFKQKTQCIRITKKELDTKPMLAIQQAVLELGAGLTTFGKRWQQHAVHIAQQFFPNTKIDRVIPAGIDPDKMVCNRVTMDTRTGEITPTEGRLEGSLLPEADGITPQFDCVRPDALENDLAYAAAYTAQLIAEIVGDPIPLVVATNEKYAASARKFLDLVGALPHQLSLETIREKYDILRPLTIQSSKPLPESMRWITCSQIEAWCYGGNRKVIHLMCGGKFRLDPKEMQNLIFSAIRYYVQSNLDSLSPIKAALNVIRNVAIRDNVTSVDIPLETYQPSRSLESIIRHSVEMRLWRITRTRPAKLQETSSWVDKEKRRFYFVSEAINATLRSYGLPQWDLESLLWEFGRSNLNLQIHTDENPEVWSVNLDQIKPQRVVIRSNKMA